MCWPWILLATLTLLVDVDCCLTTTFAQSIPRTVTWPSAPVTLDPSARTAAFLFHPPAFLDRWSKADFALFNATLTLPCSVVQHHPEVVLLPQVWIDFLPGLEAGLRPVSDPSRLVHQTEVCQLFGDETRDLVPGCQDWSRLEAWKRLRIFYDVQTAVGVDDDTWTSHRSQCGNVANATWTVAVTRMMKRWMADRSPWTRSNATLPIVVFSKQSHDVRRADLSVFRAVLNLTYWMDSE